MNAKSWTGDLSPDLNELAAFDAMRVFLEAYWERGSRENEGLASLLGSLDRNVWADCSPLDPALWDDWKDAVAIIRNASGGPSFDPLGG